MDFSSYKTWERIACVVLGICAVCYFLTRSCSSSPQITMDPIKDAQTCIKLYEKDAVKGQVYMENVISTYYMKGKHDECDKFAITVTEKIAEISMR